MNNELTPREREIITLVKSGLTAKQIAVKLLLSHRTVELHRTNAFRKLGVKSYREQIETIEIT